MFGKESHRERKHLEENGVRAPATVLDISGGGMTVTSGNSQIAANTEVVMKVHLRVEPPGQPAFEVRRSLRFSQFGIPVQGSVLAVICDPDDHDKLMLDPAPPATAAAPAGQPAALDLLAQVQQARDASGGDPMKMAEILRQSMGGQAVVMDAGALSGALGAAPPVDPLDRLEKLAHLRDEGVLTPEEFETQKKKILDET